MADARRYLIPFSPKEVPHFFTDILVIGAGIAGLRAALEVPASLRVMVITKDQVEQSNSNYAQGGIAGVLSPEDRFEDHIEDTLIAGAGLCDRAIVELVVREAPGQIKALIQWGTCFDLENGSLALTREGGHSHRRIVHALGDATGHEVMRAVIQRAREADHVSIWDKTFTMDLLTQDGRCVGAVVARLSGEHCLIWAKQTILASGGAGMVYRETTNPPVATGDGMAAAYRAGAELRDMEFMQFHPTVLYVAGSSRYLISEAAAGKGPICATRTAGRFMLDVDPRGNWPRAMWSLRRFSAAWRKRSILTSISIYPISIRQRFTVVSRGSTRCAAGSGWISHATGFRYGPAPTIWWAASPSTTTARRRCPASGQRGKLARVACTRANRLASNSLLEGLVFGTLCGQGAAQAAIAMPDAFVVPPIVSPMAAAAHEPLDVSDVTNALRSLMVRKMGIVRRQDNFA